jgi:branched-chain amino acid transport system substrate-binding protein
VLNRLLVIAVAALTLLAAGCGGDGGDGGEAAQDGASDEPIRVGTSLPLTGEYSEPGKESKAGYETWAKVVNDNGGLLGRQVEIIVRDDASKQNVAVADYTSLISQEDVDLLLGTFSSILNQPASAVAERNQMVFICPACASPDMYNRDFKFLFYGKQALATDEANALFEWIESLPEAERPKSAAYLALDDPFAGPVIDGVQEKLEGLGIETVLDEVYTPDTRNFDTLANRVASEKPDLLAQGSLFEDAVSMSRSLVKADFSPGLLFQTSAPAIGEQYAEGVGEENTEGVMTATSWDEGLETPGNQEFAAAHEELHGVPPGEEAASAYVTAEIIQKAVEAVGSVDDQAALADWLHNNEVETIIGTLSWDEAGRPQGGNLIGQWQGGNIEIILPEDVATTDQIVYPRPGWGE